MEPGPFEHKPPSRHSMFFRYWPFLPKQYQLHFSVHPSRVVLVCRFFFSSLPGTSVTFLAHLSSVVLASCSVHFHSLTRRTSLTFSILIFFLYLRSLFLSAFFLDVQNTYFHSALCCPELISVPSLS